MDLYSLTTSIAMPMDSRDDRLVSALKALILETIKEKLEVNVSVYTESNYVGDMAGNESLYKDSHNITIELVLDGEVISSQTEYLS